MNRDDIKREREIALFQHFISLSGLPIDPRSVVSRPPPEPDILCHHAEDGYLAFELTEIADSKMLHTTAAQIRGVEEPVVGYWTSDPTIKIVRSKTDKRYVSPYPIELLVTYQERAVTPEDVIVPTIRTVVEADSGQFQRIWFCGEEACLVFDART